MSYYVYKKENIYFALKVLATVFIVAAATYWFQINESSRAMVIGTIAYLSIFLFFLIIQNNLFVGYIRGTCVRVGPKQFQDIYEILCSHSKNLGLKKVPPLYIMQAGGVLNAMALRCVGKNYVVIYSDIIEAAYAEGIDAVSFVIAHELGHVRRHHIVKNTLLFPSFFIPFLGSAYSRACEYTCDGIGYELSQGGAVKGLSILSVGPVLYGKVNIRDYIEDSSRERGFWIWLARILSSHPFLPSRIANIGEIHRARG